MKKTLINLAIIAALLLPFSAAQAADAGENVNEYTNPSGNPVNQFTGKYWIEATPDEKKAWLFGIDTAITVEYFIQEKNAENNKKGKNPVHNLSVFEKAWMAAFAHMTRDQIVAEVDEWYKSHPEELSRPVMEVIWNNLIEPRIAETQPK